MPFEPFGSFLERLRARRPSGLTLLACTLVGYFGYHMVHGDRGLLAWQRIGAELEASRAELDRLTAEREELEHRVSLLRRSSLDPDLLDERARLMLSLVGSDDVVVLLEDGQDELKRTLP